MKTFEKSKVLFQKAQQFIPGGVNSPVRAFKAVGGTPLYFKEGHGAYLIDEDNNRYIDYVASWGPMILGHSHPSVVKAIQNQCAQAISFGAPCALEAQLAEKICMNMPAIEKIRLMNSGTEATMTALRLARAATGRNKILKFEGCYHGHSDSLLVKAGSGLLTFGTPSSPGVPSVLAEHTLNATFNDFSSVEKLFEKYGQDIAALIVEPIAGNMNCVLPQPDFLQRLREVCDQYKTLLIFDEVITGFRVALGGAQALFNIQPDLTTLGKIIGGGLPVGAVGGKKEWMEQLAPTGPVYQAGTLSGNPVTMAAGLATLTELEQPHFYENLAKTTDQLITGFKECAAAAKIPLTINQAGSLFGFFFSAEEEIHTYQQVMTTDVNRFKQFFHAMLMEGIYLAPSAFEAAFVSAAHGKLEIEQTLTALAKVFNIMK